MNNTLDNIKELVKAFTRSDDKQATVENELSKELLNLNKKRNVLPKEHKQLIETVNHYRHDKTERNAYKCYDALLALYNSLIGYDNKATSHAESIGIVTYTVEGNRMTYYTNYPQYSNDKATTYKVIIDLVTMTTIKEAMNRYYRKGNDNLYL